MSADNTLLTIAITIAIPIGAINLILLCDIMRRESRRTKRTALGNTVSQGGKQRGLLSRGGLSSADDEGDGPTVADALSNQLNLSRAEVRRTMLAGGVVHDGSQLRDPDEPARYYRGQEVAYGRRGTRIVIGEDE